MPAYKTIIQKFSNNKEKTGWSYVEMPVDIWKKLKLKNRREFRVKGFLDDVNVERLSCMPMKDGNFIIPLNAELRKKLGKNEGAMLHLKIEVDTSPALQSAELMECLNDDDIALKQFNSLLLSHRNYFHRYVYTAKGAATKAGRIVNVINAMHKKQDFGEMMRSLKKT
ncbi:MAG: DUF1905 domain-containing protein [Bacteroidetes bacterium]|nr:DUF1905 domain-containing protein [Bacteroidota bacterium]